MLVKKDEVYTPHTGSYNYHSDDCRCVEADLYCNRDGHVWSCCGSTKKDSNCSVDVMHPTYWNHPKSSSTTTGEYINHWPVHKTNEEIDEAFPEIFKK